jgi:hypothetical protein
MAATYRDAATIVSIVFGFSLAILAIGFSNSGLANAVGGAICIPTVLVVILGAVLIFLSLKMLQYDAKAAQAQKEKP